MVSGDVCFAEAYWFVLSIVSGLPTPFTVLEEWGTDGASLPKCGPTIGDGNGESEALWREETISALELALQEQRLAAYTRDPASGDVCPLRSGEWAPTSVEAALSQGLCRMAPEGEPRLVLFNRSEFERWLADEFETAIFSEADWSAIASR